MTETTQSQPIKAATQEINGVTFMTRSDGSLIPMENIKQSDLDRDEFVREIAASWLNHSNTLAAFKSKVMGDIMAFSELAAEKYEIKIGSAKGAYTLSTFDGEYKLKISIGDIKDVNEKFQLSKIVIDEYIAERGTESDPNMVAIVNALYQTSDKGKVNIQIVFSLLQAEVHDPTGKWNKAMELLKDSIVITGSKPYVRLYKRNELGKYDNVPLDIAAL